MSIPEMEIYDKIQSLEFSLKTICAVNVVHRILDSIGMKRKDYQGLVVTKILEHVTTEASKRVETLDLPTGVKQLLEVLIRPIYREVDAWHNVYLLENCPTWTPYGTVDLVRSSRTVVDDPNLKASYRFKVACTFCHERQVFELAKRLTRQEMAAISRTEPYGKPSSHVYQVEQLNWKWIPLIRFWLDVIRDGSFHLPQETLLKGLLVALKGDNDAAAMYFLGRLEPEGVLMGIDGCVDAWREFIWDELSPATDCLLYSKLSDPEHRRVSFKSFVYALLESLTRWPYQPLFLDAARSLCIRLKESTVAEMLSIIARKASQGFKDYDYRGLFVGFCETIARLHPEWSLGKRHASAIAWYVLLTEDELWMNFVWGKLSHPEKRSLLFYDDCRLVVRLMSLKKHHLLEPFIRLCCGNRINLLLKVRDVLMHPRSWSEPYGISALQQLIPEIVKKLIAEREASKRMPSRETSKKKDA